MFLLQGDAADRATPGISRWEPRFPLERPYRRPDAAYQLLWRPSPTRWWGAWVDVTAFAVSS